MDFGWLSGCVGVAPYAVAILPTKRFLTSLACAVSCRAAGRYKSVRVR
jgi:hypothetical protein